MLDPHAHLTERIALLERELDNTRALAAAYETQLRALKPRVFPNAVDVRERGITRATAIAWMDQALTRLHRVDDDGIPLPYPTWTTGGEEDDRYTAVFIEHSDHRDPTEIAEMIEWVATTLTIDQWMVLDQMAEMADNGTVDARRPEPHQSLLFAADQESGR